MTDKVAQSIIDAVKATNHWVQLIADRTTVLLIWNVILSALVLYLIAQS